MGTIEQRADGYLATALTALGPKTKVCSDIHAAWWFIEKIYRLLAIPTSAPPTPTTPQRSNTITCSPAKGESLSPRTPTRRSQPGGKIPVASEDAVLPDAAGDR